MTSSGKIYWDERNSSRPFLWFWVLTQFVLLLRILSIKFHAPNSSISQTLLIVSVLLGIGAIAVFAQLVVNCIWHRTQPDSGDDGDSSESLGISPLNLEEHPVSAATSDSGPKFDTNLESDPIETRDQIQWKKLLIATAGIGTLALSFYATF